jgi:predicted transcriptional regulator YdeE
VQGVEVPTDYQGVIPEGLEVIELPPAKYLMFQGEAFAEEDFEEAIGQVWDGIKKYNPSVLGYTWDEENPRVQLEPRGERGYIEFVAIK